MALFLADENVPHAICAKLRELGNDVLTLNDAGLANQGTSDSFVLGFALNQNRILVTFDRRDYIRLHNGGTSHAGIVVCTFDRNFAEQASLIHTQTAEISMTGVLIRVNRPTP